MLHQIDNTSRVSILVIIPGHKLDKVGVEHDTGIGIKDGGAHVTLEIGGDEGFVAVSKESLHVTLRSCLEVGADFFVGGALLDLAGQVNDRDINGGDTESHTSELSNKGRDDLGDGLGGTGAGGDDISRSSTSSAPVLAGRRVDDGLCGGHGVNSGHECLLDDEFIVDSLDHGCETVGGA